MNNLLNMDVRIICLFLCVASVLSFRIKRAGGRVNLPPSITPPRKLHKGQTPEPKPGWTHCIRDVKVTNQWRVISSEGVASQATQFQCTWRLKSDTGEQIQISIQKLNLGNSDDTRCQQQFLELIDHGKTQGRYCDRSIPGDYVSIGSDVRIDIQGEGDLVKLVRDSRSPFLISYKSVPVTEPGFRYKVSKPDKYDPHHLNTQNQVRQHKTLQNKNPGYVPTKPKKKNNDKNKEAKYGMLSLAGLVSIIVCAILVFIVVCLILLNRCCCCWRKKKDVKKDAERGNSKTKHKGAFLMPSVTKAPNERNIRPTIQTETTSNNSSGENQINHDYLSKNGHPTKVKITTSSQGGEKKQSSRKRIGKMTTKEKIKTLNIRSGESKNRSSKSKSANRKQNDEKNNNTTSRSSPGRSLKSKKSSDKRKSLDKVSSKARRRHRRTIEKDEPTILKFSHTPENRSSSGKVRPYSSKSRHSNHRKQAEKRNNEMPRRRAT